ncbi:Dihydroceramide fatty acyl 2-hydroxylase FAH2 [Linum perenne]
MMAKGFVVDLDKPLVFQVGHLGEAYDEWVHQPIVSREGPRFFANDVMEALTRTVWWAIPAIWLPVVCWFTLMSARMGLALTEFWNMVKLMATPSTTPALFAGGLLGYIMYDCTHYYLHHGQPSNEVPKNLKKYHMNHHFRVQDKGFGITSSLWDRVFGTLPPSKEQKKSR